MQTIDYVPLKLKVHKDRNEKRFRSTIAITKDFHSSAVQYFVVEQVDLAEATNTSDGYVCHFDL